MKSFLTVAALALAGVMVVAFVPRTQGYAIGDEVADFSLLNIDGKKVSLSEMTAAKGFIVVFTCNHCPFSVKYEDKLNALDKQFRPKGYPVVAINSNDATKYPADSYDNMKVRAREKKFSFPYLYDETQDVAKRFGAEKTPHTFVVNKEGGKMVVRYMGAIDDNPNNPKASKTQYVGDAVNALLSGKPVATPVTKAVGCGVKWRS